ncbi:MAG: tryptophan--tRNA ligase [Clostridiales bacterium]|nr:tryptophan--tRNA ligase [Clostridiales bacterium]
MIQGKKVVYSATQPTGSITLGNYIGAIKNWLKLNQEYFTIFAIADLHALTVRQVPADFRKRALSFFAQYIALGLDPEKNILYFQSHVPQHAELTWILNCFTYIGETGRMTQFKEKSSKHNDNINMGLMDYPVLMASDILLYQADLVPVGIDQKQHLELTRDLAIRFNNLYSPTFTVPEPYIGKQGAKIFSLQSPTEKMSKSDPNPNATISLLDEPDAVMRKFKRAVTDSDGVIKFSEDKPGVSNLLTILSAVTDKGIADIEKDFAGKGYAELKKVVGEAVVEFLQPIQSEYNRLIADKAYLMSVAKDGAEKAQAIARRTLSKVYKKIGLVQL